MKSGSTLAGFLIFGFSVGLDALGAFRLHFLDELELELQVAVRVELRPLVGFFLRFGPEELNATTLVVDDDAAPRPRGKSTA